MRQFLAILINLSLILPIFGQQAPGALTIVLLKGEGGRNSIKTRSNEPIQLEVRDAQGKPLAGAQVIFQLPSFGASGSFPGGQLTGRTVTGPSGQATMSGFVPNDVEGRFSIKITADSGTQTGTLVVQQINVATLPGDKPKSHTGLWIAIAAGAGGAIVAGVLAGKGGGSSGGGSSSPPAPSVTISTGTLTVGGPH
jgi:hypothetical protein